VRKSWAAAAVGGLVLLALVLSAVIFKYTTERVGSDEGFVVYALFNDARGLTEKSRVTSAGLAVGQIETRVLDPASGKAKINIRIYEGLKLYENALVSKKAASLLGELYLDLDPGTPMDSRSQPPRQNRELKDGDQIVNVFEGTNFENIMNQVDATLPILKEILRDVQDLTSGSVKEIADGVNQMIAKNSVTLERLLTRVDNIAADVEGITDSESDDIKVSLRNVRQITEGLKSLVGTSEGEVTSTGKELRTSVQKLQGSVDSLERSLRNMEKITGKVADGEGTVGHLVNDPTIAENVEQITEDASSFVRGVSRLQTILGLRMEYNYLARTFKTYFQIQLAPRPDKFFLIEVADDPRGFRKQTSRIVDSSERGTVSETTVETSEQLRITAQFGKCFGPVCGRFGLKESTGGLGLDLHLLNEWLTLSADIFDTRSNAYPRVQGRAIVNVYKRHVALIAGVDDILNYTQTRSGAGGFFDWFFGAQLQFNDEDLKSLMLFGGSAIAGAASSK
jgi:phospholipid/cholesterol/gamma-HCH transport system substrate-binding protein